MPRFDLISNVQPGRDSEIKNRFIRMLAQKSARLAPDLPRLPLSDEEEASVRTRYAPMHRLLTQDDDLFLSAQGLPGAAKKLRREHRRCYFGYLAQLRSELRAGRKLGTLAMASQEKWNFHTLLTHTLIAESSLLYLQWLGCRHAVGVSVGARDVKECLDFLLAGQRFRLATT